MPIQKLAEKLVLSKQKADCKELVISKQVIRKTRKLRLLFFVSFCIFVLCCERFSRRIPVTLIDELDGFFNAFFDAFFAFCRFLSRNFFGILKVTIKTICICRLGPARKDGNYDEIKKRF